MTSVINFDSSLLRRGGNQFGVIAFSAGLAAYFLEEKIAMSNAVTLAGIGFVVYIFSSVTTRSKRPQTNGGKT